MAFLWDLDLFYYCFYLFLIALMLNPVKQISYICLIAICFLPMRKFLNNAYHIFYRKVKNWLLRLTFEIWKYDISLFLCCFSLEHYIYYYCCLIPDVCYFYKSELYTVLDCTHMTTRQKSYFNISCSLIRFIIAGLNNKVIPIFFTNLSCLITFYFRSS